MPTNTTQMMLASSEPTPPPYTTDLPNGVRVRPAILNAWMPSGMPTMVMHSTMPMIAHATASSRPPRISHRILPNVFMSPIVHGVGDMVDWSGAVG